MSVIIVLAVFLSGWYVGRIIDKYRDERRAKLLAKNIIELTEEMVVDDNVPPEFLRRVK